MFFIEDTSMGGKIVGAIDSMRIEEKKNYLFFFFLLWFFVFIFLGMNENKDKK